MEWLLYYILIPILSVVLLYRYVQHQIALELIRKVNKKGPEFGITSVLYLRAFGMDGDVPKEVINFFNVKYEHHIVYDFAKIRRPVMAIAGQKDLISTLDLNMQVLTPDNANWKKTVTEKMQSCCLILLRPMYTEGVLWEFEKIVTSNFLSKTILLLQMGGVWEVEVQKARYELFVKKTAYLGLTFPEYKPGELLVYFEENQALTCDMLTKIPVFNSLIINKENFREGIGN